MPKEITDQMYAWPLNVPETGELLSEIVLSRSLSLSCFFLSCFHNLP